MILGEPLTGKPDWEAKYLRSLVVNREIRRNHIPQLDNLNLTIQIKMKVN